MQTAGSRKKKQPPITGNTRIRQIKVATILASWPFKQGIKDFHDGKWSEVRGTWRGFSAANIYENARLVCALVGAKAITVNVYLQAREGGAIPPATQRARLTA
jgi:hypothetical protein